MFNLNKIYEEIGIMINKKFEEFEVKLYESLGKKLKKNLIDKKGENKEAKKVQIKMIRMKLLNSKEKI